MKYLLLPMILLLSACASTLNESKDVELTGRLLGSYVSTSSGLLKGNILHLNETGSIQKVSATGNGNPRKVLLKHDNQDYLSNFAGKQVIISGKLRTEHKEVFHTDFVLSVQKIVEQE